MKTKPATFQSWWIKNAWAKPNKQPYSPYYERGLQALSKPIQRPMRRLTIKIIYGTKQ